MSEADTIRKSKRPATVASLKADLSALGVEPGMLLLVHSSLSSLGWVSGGAQAVVQAMMETLTDVGTLVMPAHSTGNSEPSHWQHPPVPEDWWQTIRDSMPGFDRKVTPTRGMGAIAELFRTVPDVRRSDHPSCSFCAWGRYAHAITADHRLDSRLGEDSPLARVYDLDGRVLLLGVGHDRNTSLHLCEQRAEWAGKEIVEQGAAVQFGDGRQWVTYRDLRFQDDDFAEIGRAFEQEHEVATGKVAIADCRLFKQRELVDFGVEWMNAHRK
jgi:aminoglycoside 3-N-acetyltransferase